MREKKNLKIGKEIAGSDDGVGRKKINSQEP